MDKYNSQQSHFIKRIRQRYGINCDEILYRRLKNFIRKRKSIFMFRSGNRCSCHKIYMPVSFVSQQNRIKVAIENDATVKIYVIYDKQRKSLVTALPWFNTDERFLKYHKKAS